MMKENYRQRPPREDIMFDSDISNSVSATEFTGMLPTPPLDEDEEESYMNIMEYSPKEVDVFSKKENKL